MTSALDKLNLRPGERRLVVVIGLVVFALINWLFVWSHFGDWKKLQRGMKSQRATLDRFQTEIAKTDTYRKELDELKKKGAAFPTEEQALQLQRNVQSQAALSGVQINSYTPASRTGGKTNQFFEEQGGTISVLTEEKALVDFLWNLGTGGSLIRVRSMSLNPDPTHMKLMGNITLVASYPRQVVPAAPAKASGPGAKGAASKSPLGSARTNLTSFRATNLTATATNTAAKPGVLSRLKSFFSKEATKLDFSKPGSTNPAPAKPAGPPAKTNAPPRK